MESLTVEDCKIMLARGIVTICADGKVDHFEEMSENDD